MMLTDEEIIQRIPSACVNDDTELFLLALSELVTFARAVIAANNAKVLEGMKPQSLHVKIEGVYFDGRSMQSRMLMPVAYSADQVAPLIQRVKELEAYLEGDATCPCCGQSVKCLDGCTFDTDAPHDHDKMQEVRKLLEQVK